jgi:hypothetical protein
MVCFVRADHGVFVRHDPEDFVAEEEKKLGKYRPWTFAAKSVAWRRSKRERSDGGVKNRPARVREVQSKRCYCQSVKGKVRCLAPNFHKLIANPFCLPPLATQK